MSVVNEPAVNKEEMNVKKEVVIPENFSTIIDDFTRDILITFPECSSAIELWWTPTVEEVRLKQITNTFNHCLKVYPERFFDILYKNEDIFKNESTASTEFLPYIIFKHLWKCEITENTKTSIWKYLQLILFSVVNNVTDGASFGNAAELFNTIEVSDFKTKLHDALNSVQEVLTNTIKKDEDDTNDSANTSTNASSMPSNMNCLPSADEIHNHMNGMFKGQLGDLAKELAEETAQGLDIDFNNVTDAKDIFQNLFKNPSKLMNIVKNVSEKLDSRIKSGKLNESELISEATEIMNNMKNIPGFENMQEMLSKMGMGPGMMGAAGMGQGMGQQTHVPKPARATQVQPKKQKLDLKQIQEQQQKITQQYEEDLKLNNILNDEQVIAMFNQTQNQSKDSKDSKSKKSKDKKDKH